MFRTCLTVALIFASCLTAAAQNKGISGMGLRHDHENLEEAGPSIGRTDFPLPEFPQLGRRLPAEKSPTPPGKTPTLTELAKLRVQAQSTAAKCSASRLPLTRIELMQQRRDVEQARRELSRAKLVPAAPGQK